MFTVSTIMRDYLLEQATRAERTALKLLDRAIRQPSGEATFVKAALAAERRAGEYRLRAAGLR